MKVAELFEEEERSVLSVMGDQPDHFDGNFFCNSEGLTSLKGSPTLIDGHFFCYLNMLTSLEGAPSSVGHDFDCHNNKISSLEGAPTSVGRDFSCHNNKLTSLHNIHKQIKHIGRYMHFDNNPISSCVLGLLLIDGLKFVYIDNKKVEKIINKHLQGEKDVFACQEELIENGFGEFAKL